jgi:hypothetical protein
MKTMRAVQYKTTMTQDNFRSVVARDVPAKSRQTFLIAWFIDITEVD